MWYSNMCWRLQLSLQSCSLWYRKLWDSPNSNLQYMVESVCCTVFQIHHALELISGWFFPGGLTRFWLNSAAFGHPPSLKVLLVQSASQLTEHFQEELVRTEPSDDEARIPASLPTLRPTTPITRVFQGIMMVSVNCQLL